MQEEQHQRQEKPSRALILSLVPAVARAAGPLAEPRSIAGAEGAGAAAVARRLVGSESGLRQLQPGLGQGRLVAVVAGASAGSVGKACAAAAAAGAAADVAEAKGFDVRPVAGHAAAGDASVVAGDPVADGAGVVAEGCLPGPAPPAPLLQSAEAVVPAPSTAGATVLATAPAASGDAFVVMSHHGSKCGRTAIVDVWGEINGAGERDWGRSTTTWPREVMASSYEKSNTYLVALTCTTSCQILISIAGGSRPK